MANFGLQIETASAPPPTDSWTLVTASGTAPSGVGSARVQVNLFKTPGNDSPFSVFVDTVRFGPTPTTPVTLSGLDAE